jgi:hypothetical protein
MRAALSGAPVSLDVKPEDGAASAIASESDDEAEPDGEFVAADAFEEEAEPDSGFMAGMISMFTYAFGGATPPPALARGSRGSSDSDEDSDD